MVTCPQCAKTFRTMGALSSHVTQVHTATIRCNTKARISLPKEIDIPTLKFNHKFDNNKLSSNMSLPSFDTNDPFNTSSTSSTNGRTNKHVNMLYDKYLIPKPSETTGINNTLQNSTIEPQSPSAESIELFSTSDSVLSEINDTDSISTHTSCIINQDYNYNPLLGAQFNTDKDQTFTDTHEPFFSTYVTSSHTTNFKHYCSLLDLCQRLGTTLDGFNLILKWTQKANNEGFDFNTRHPTRQIFVDRLKKLVDLPPPEPIIIPLEHTTGAKDEDKKITVWRYCFHSQFTRIMNCEKLMKPENIVCNNPKQPYNMYIPSEKVDESQDGFLYQNALKHLCLNVDKDFVIGVDIYADSTWCDVLGRYSCEPVVASFSIFKRHVRQTPNAQVLLGFISDMDHKSSAEGDQDAKNSTFKGMKYRNYHRQLDILFAGIRKLQRGFECRMNLCHQIADRNIILPILTIIGDGKSQDMMVGRYGTSNLKTARLMWMCDCPPNNADNPSKTCTLMKEESVRFLSGIALGFYTPKNPNDTNILSTKQACQRLQQISQYVGDNAFFHLLKVTDCLTKVNQVNNGIFRITPMCGLHAIAPGLGKNIVETMLISLSVHNKADLDRLVIRMFTSRRQSGRNEFPIPNLSKGLSNLSKKTSDEWMGVVFYLGIIFRSGIGRHLLADVIQKKFSADGASLEDQSIFLMFQDYPAIDNFGYMLECLSCYDAFNKKPGGYWNANIPLSCQVGEATTLESISKMLLMFRGNCPMIKSILPNGQISQRGNGWKRQKFHLHLHLPQWISDLGSPSNYNTQRFESNHKVIVKNVSNNVQKRGFGKFLSQIAQRGYERQLLSITMEKLDIEPIYMYNTDNMIKDLPIQNTTFKLSWYTNQATQFEISIGLNGHVTQNWNRSRAKNAHLEISPIVCTYLSKVFGNKNTKVLLGCVTKLRLPNRKIIRCHPNYQGEGEWSDWILVQCSNSTLPFHNQKGVFKADKYDKQTPGKIVLLIISIDNIKLESPIVVVRSCREQDEDSCNFDSIFLTRFAKSYNSEGSPNFTHLKITEALDRVFVLEDFFEMFENMEDRNQMILEGHSMPVCWYHPNENKPLLCNGTRNTMSGNKRRRTRERVHESLIDDWVYVVIPYKEWANKFSDLS